eukprot:6380804-Pyramimonas_sp.AAC.1
MTPPVGDTSLETRRERPISPSWGVNRPVGPRPRRWGWGSVQRYSEEGALTCKSGMSLDRRNLQK